ncbi:hypothetical protein IPZ58_15360 [Streptomyces roseoverticillatus]|uniref:hypothetical protein n=1 Tax=Streptomyces roseoverticillatus TaxID=66429 RepID=UPI001F40F5A4|nr:hypothetical protein [Streptomyces roseoverticillatus]MCF3102958.1 hypothetical protein [Streptomyces roseoverticillatus]
MTPVALAITLLLGVTLCYVAVCAASPFGRCRKCDGLGFRLDHRRNGKPKRGKHCRRCDGHGIRIRFGRHLWNGWTRTYRQGTDAPAAKRPQKG